MPAPSERHALHPVGLGLALVVAFGAGAAWLDGVVRAASPAPDARAAAVREPSPLRRSSTSREAAGFGDLARLAVAPSKAPAPPRSPASSSPFAAAASPAGLPWAPGGDGGAVAAAASRHGAPLFTPAAHPKSPRAPPSRS